MAWRQPQPQRHDSLAELTALAGLTESFNQQAQAQQVIQQNQQKEDADMLMKLLGYQQGQTQMADAARHAQALESLTRDNNTSEAAAREATARYQEMMAGTAQQNATSEAGARTANAQHQEALARIAQQQLDDAKATNAQKMWLDVYGEQVRAGLPVDPSVLSQLPNGDAVVKAQRETGIRKEQGQMMSQIGPMYVQAQKTGNTRDLQEALKTLGAGVSNPAQQEAWDTLPWESSKLNWGLPGATSSSNVTSANEAGAKVQPALAAILRSIYDVVPNTANLVNSGVEAGAGALGIKANLGRMPSWFDAWNNFAQPQP